MPTVSIAMATYNGGKFLAQQLESLVSQTTRPLELVVTDDNSSDETVAIVSRFAETAPFPVHLHRNDARLGFRRNFMKAIGLCAGDVIACCDQDDIWQANKLERVSAAFGTDQAIKLVFHGAWLIDGQGDRIGPANLLALPPRSQPLTFFPLLGMLGFAMAFRRELVGYSNYWPCSVDHLSPSNVMAHDQWYPFMASATGDIVYLDERLVEYRQHGGNAYGVKSPTLASTIAYRPTNHGHVHRDFSAAALSRASLLRDMMRDGMFVSTISPVIETTIDFYEKLAARLALRGQIYLERNLLKRIKAFRTLKSSGGYEGGSIWNIGQKAALKDVVVGLVLRPLMIKPPETNSIA